MNLKSELQMMTITDLRAVCRELGVSCPTTKSGIIKRLLLPLKKGYRMEHVIKIEDLTNPSRTRPAPLTFNREDLTNLVVINRDFYNAFKQQLKKYEKLYRILKRGEDLNRIYMLSPPKLRRLRALPVPIDGAYGILDENNNFIIPDASHAIGNQKLLSNSGSTRSDYVQKYRGPT